VSLPTGNVCDAFSGDIANKATLMEGTFIYVGFYTSINVAS
jgi:hypothetical protein